MLTLAPVKLGESNGEGGYDKHEDDAELGDINEHASQRDLKGSQVGVCLEQVVDTGKTVKNWIFQKNIAASFAHT